MSHRDATVIMTFPDRVSAEIAASLLSSHGIDAHVWADDVGGAYPQLGMSRGVKLLVASDQADHAREILERRMSSRSQTGDMAE